MADEVKDEAPEAVVTVPAEVIEGVEASEALSDESSTIGDLADLGDAMAAPVADVGEATNAVLAPVEPEIDAQGRAYATGKRKNAVARVWIKPGSGKLTVNGREFERYFARPVLRMVI